MKRGTLILTGLTILVVGYALYDYQNEKRETKQADEKARFLQLDPDQINEFSVSTPGAEEILVSKDKEGWSMKKPVEDLANQKASDEFIDGLVTERSLGVAVEGDRVDLSGFGLDHPQAVIKVKNYAGETASFAIGSVKNFQGDAFIRINQDKKVLVGSSTWFAKGQKHADDFRDKRWLRTNAALVQKMDFQKFQLIKDQDQWISPQEKKWKLDQNKVREILSMLNTTEGIEVIADPKNPVRPEELKKWGLVQPRVDLKLSLKDGPLWEAKIATGEDKVQRVQVSPPNYVFKISPTDADKFSQATLDSFRDRHEPFDFDRNKVGAVSINLNGKTRQFKMESGIWKSSGGEVDQEKMRGFLQMLSALTVEKFENAKNPTLDQEISLKDDTGNEIFKMNWSPGILSLSAKTSLYGAPILIREQDLTNLRPEGLIVSKKEEKK